VLIFQVWKWNRVAGDADHRTVPAVDALFFASNITKIADGGWFPLLVAAVIFTVLTTWATGRR
jgi:KUP system potassium uptake protein